MQPEISASESLTNQLLVPVSVISGNISPGTFVTPIVTVLNSEGDEAIAGEDFFIASTLNPFTSDTTDQLIQLNLIPDEDFEGDETFTLLLSLENAEGVTLTQTTSRITILDDDQVAVRFERALYELTEGEEIVVVIDLTLPTSLISEDTEIRVRVVPALLPEDNLLQGTDYTIVGRDRLTFDGDNLEDTIRLQILDDNIFEPGRFSLRIELLDPLPFDIITNVANFVVTDNDEQSRFVFSVPEIAEGETARIYLEESNRAAEAPEKEFRVFILPVTAETADYTFTTETLVLSEGNSRAGLDIEIVDDGLFERDETFEIFVEDTDNDIIVARQIITIPHIPEPVFLERVSPDRLDFLVRLRDDILIAPDVEDLTVYLHTYDGVGETLSAAIAGEDYVPLNAEPIVFNANTIARTVAVTVNTRSIAVETKSFRLSIVSPEEELYVSPTSGDYGIVIGGETSQPSHIAECISSYAIPRSSGNSVDIAQCYEELLGTMDDLKFEAEFFTDSQTFSIDGDIDVDGTVLTFTLESPAVDVSAAFDITVSTLDDVTVSTSDERFSFSRTDRVTLSSNDPLRFICGSILADEEIPLPVPFEECEALVRLYLETSGDSWFNSDDWFSPYLNDWFGVTVTTALETGDGRAHVVELNLSGNALAGEIPQELANLANLRVLNLGINGLDGAIPPELGSLTDLRVLDLRVTRLNGAIPPNWAT